MDGPTDGQGNDEKEDASQCDPHDGSRDLVHGVERSVRSLSMGLSRREDTAARDDSQGGYQ